MTDTDTEALRAALADPLDVLAVYGRDDGHRDWLTAGCWVRHGEVIAHCSADLPERIARLLDALDEARKDAERYRALRLDHEGELLPDIALYSGRALDDYIDAAMKAAP